VKAPKDRDYYHRVKIRFDWVESQGTPWWLGHRSSAGGVDEQKRSIDTTTQATPISAIDAHESHLLERTAESKAYPVTQLDGGYTAIIANGLPTPPNTPPDKICTPFEKDEKLGERVVNPTLHNRRRLPGDAMLRSSQARVMGSDDTQLW
jgi:hypothetical protein